MPNRPQHELGQVRLGPPPVPRPRPAWCAADPVGQKQMPMSTTAYKWMAFTFSVYRSAGSLPGSSKGCHVCHRRGFGSPTVLLVLEHPRSIVLYSMALGPCLKKWHQDDVLGVNGVMRLTRAARRQVTDAVKATSEMGRKHLMYLVVPAARLYMASPVREQGGKGGWAL